MPPSPSTTPATGSLSKNSDIAAAINTSAVAETTDKHKMLFAIKRILIVDDDEDVILTFKAGLEDYFANNGGTIKFEACVYNNPYNALAEFKPGFYDILLTDINMPYMDGFQLADKISAMDLNLRICFISAAELNIEALRELYPKLALGCFIKKPVTIEYLVKRLVAELD